MRGLSFKVIKTGEVSRYDKKFGMKCLLLRGAAAPAVREDFLTQKLVTDHLPFNPVHVANYKTGAAAT